MSFTWTTFEVTERLDEAMSELNNKVAVVTGASKGIGAGIAKKLAAQLTSALERLRPLQWLEKHSDVSDEDFAKDPARHRLAILVSRTNHAAFHTGQIILTK